MRHLLDDSVLEEPNLASSQIVDLDENSPDTPTDTLNDDCSLLSRTRYVNAHLNLEIYLIQRI